MDFGDFGEDIELNEVVGGGDDMFQNMGSINFDGLDDFGFDNVFSAAGSLPALHTIPGMSDVSDAYPSGVPAPSTAAPVWLPAEGGIIASSGADPRFTFCVCCIGFFILTLLVLACIALSIVVIVMVFQVDYDVTHLKLVLVQPVNLPPQTFQVPQIPYV